MEKLRYQKIKPSEISPEFQYGLRYRVEDDQILRSVKERGILQPLILREGSPKMILSGHRRYAAARTLGIREMDALIDCAGRSERDCFLYALYSNMNQVWPDLDRAWTIRKSMSEFGFNQSEVLKDLLPVLGLPSGINVLQEYLRVAELDSSLLDRIASKEMSFSGAHVLSKLNKENQQCFAERIIAQAALTSSELLQVGEWLHDLLKLHHSDLMRYLTDHELQKLLSHETWDRRQKAEKFYHRMRHLRFPRLSDHERQFDDLKAEILKGYKNIQVGAPQHFEDKGFVIHAKIRDPQSLQHLSNLLENKKSALISLFDIKL